MPEKPAATAAAVVSWVAARASRCTSSWLRINDGGSARVDFAQNAEALDDWSILREEEGQETRYLQVQVESVAPLPLVTGTLGPAIPVLRPAARSVVGTLGSAVRDHSLATAESKAITLKELLETHGREALMAAMEDTSDPVESSTSSQLGREVLRPIWQELQDEAIGKLEAISIEDLCRRARDSGVEGGNQPIEVDFAI